MKTPLFFFLLLCGVSVAQAQNDSATSYSYYAKAAAPPAIKRNIIKIAPFRLAASTMSISYERAFSPRSSFMVTGLLTSATKDSYNGYDVIAFGGGGDVEFRTYPLVEYTPMKGYFVGLYGSFNHTNFDYQENNSSYYNPGYPAPTDEYITRFGTGIMMGYQFIIKETISFDLYAGGGIRKVQTNINHNNSYYYNPYDILSSGTSSGIYPRAGFNFGLCF